MKRINSALLYNLYIKFCKSVAGAVGQRSFFKKIDRATNFFFTIF